MPWLKVSALNESPSEKEGKSSVPYLEDLVLLALNESPSEKEGKLPWGIAHRHTMLSPQ